MITNTQHGRPLYSLGVRALFSHSAIQHIQKVTGIRSLQLSSIAVTELDKSHGRRMKATFRISSIAPGEDGQGFLSGLGHINGMAFPAALEVKG